MRTVTHFTKVSIGQTMKRGFIPATSPRRTEALDMATGEVHAIDAGHRRRDVIRCVAGRLWLTQEGDLQDHLLQAGDVFITAHAGLILVSALENSRVEVASTRNGRC